MNGYHPSSLPSIDAVEIVDIRGINPGQVSRYMQAARDATSVRCDSEAAQELADVWRGLPPGETSRCHIPPIGFRFLVGETAVLQASVCWQCNNIFGLEDERDVFYAFDSESTPANRLFLLAQQVIGSDILGEG